jgi:hypothetical protein
MGEPDISRGTSDARARRRRRVAAGSLALAVSSGLGLGGARPAGAATPAASAVCTLEDGFNRYDVDARATGLPQDRVLDFLLIMESPDDRFFIDGIPVNVEDDGTYEIPSGINFSGLPVRVGWVIYEDTDGNGRWSVNRDDTIFRGDGDVTACPQTVTLSPK